MVDEDLEKLSPQDYSQKPREQTLMQGQKAAVSFIDTQDKLDMLRMDIIDKDPKVLELMSDESEFGMKGKELLKWAKGTRNQFLFAIRGSEKVKPEEIGELQGWVQFMPDSEERLNKMKEKGFIETPAKETTILEISYAKFPQAEKGQIASGVRQSLLLLTGELERRDKRRTAAYKRKPLITAYVDPKGNKESVLVLEHCGFKKVGKMKYEETETDENDVYILDWQMLYQKLYQPLMDLFKR